MTAITKNRRPHRSRIWTTRKPLSLLPLAAVFALVTLLGALSQPHGAVSAAPLAVGNEPWLEMNCLETVVEEGNDFRLQVDKKYDSEWPHKTMKVWWYTHPITADETDYERLHQERQLSNGYQSRHGRMGRTFHTLEDDYPEIDETFRVEFLNGVSKGHDGVCVITITDDDGVGIHDLEITSAPHQLTDAQGQQQVGYAVGDVIEITAHFTGDVTTVNPETGEPSDYAGIHLFVGNNRRLASFLRSYGSDALVFGYTVRPEDADADGISIEKGGLPLIGLTPKAATGFHYDRQHRDIGIWPASSNHDTINPLYHGRDDDPAHRVFQIENETEEPGVDPPTDTDIPPVPEPEPPVWVENSEVIENGAFHIEHGELTEVDGGRDWFSFTGFGGVDYIIEVESRVRYLESGSTLYVDNHLKDPSVLEIIDHQGNQVMGEQDQGGFTGNWARAYFKPETDGAYYIAVGSGREDRGGFGHYTISVRQDDHADDWRTKPDLTLRPNQSITARINSDVAPDDANPNAWSWAETGGGNAAPRWGIVSADDKDVFRLDIPEAGEYFIGVLEGPPEVGLWAFFEQGGNGGHLSSESPVRSVTRHFEPGIHYVAVGTPYRSVGNTGPYTLRLADVPNGDSADGG